MKIKICGITNSEDALLAEKLGADVLGFVFAKSPRKVTEQKVHSILKIFKFSTYIILSEVL